MKKDYESPKAEKIDFNYTEAVTASGTTGQGGQSGSENGSLEQVWVGNQTHPSATNCAKQWRKVC